METDVRREHIELPTCEMKPENPDPAFGQHCGAYPYPYRLQNRLTHDPVMREHEAVILENEYLRLLFLPGFGCRLFSAWDKLLGREVFHRNHSIKPALIAIRGAWISGGIEYNFPIGHSVYTHSRIPCATRRNPDGSGSVIFGLTEQMTGMRFTIQVSLAPDEYRFSQHARLYNGTHLPHRHYWWTNAAMPETPKTQLIYPMTRGISGAHGGEISWPEHDGLDLSWAANHRFSGDVFAAETYDEFFGVYHWDLERGVAHWARQDELPARKMFFWGRDEMGRLWQRVLDEDAGDYLEIQAGRFATQGDFRPLMPHELVEFTEFWIPVGKTDGFVKAHREGIINVRPDGAGAEVTVQAARRVTDGRIRAWERGFRHEQAVDLSPGEVFRFHVDHSPSTLRVTVLDVRRNVLMAYDPQDREKVRDRVPRGTEECPPPDDSTPQASAYRSACDAFRAGDYPRALELCGDSGDPMLSLLSAAARRKMGESAEDAIPSDDPLWRHAHWERLFTHPGSRITSPVSSTSTSTSKSKSESTESFQEDIDAAEWYFDLGMRDEAGAILMAWKDAVPPEDPFFDVLAEELGIELPETRRPDEPGIVNCFAHRETLTRLLEKRTDPVSRLHLGNMLYMQGRTDEAVECWENARSSESHLPCRNLALAYWQRRDDPETACRHMREAAEINPSDADTLSDLDILAEITGRYSERPEIAERILRYASDDSQCIERAVRALLECGRLDEAVEIVTTKRFFVKELAYQTRIPYVRALVERGARSYGESRFEEAADDFRRATEYPASLGVGKLHDSSDAQAFYLLGLALEKLGRHAEARRAWESAADDVSVRGSEQAFYVGRARERLARGDAREVFERILPEGEPADSEYARARHAYLLGLHNLANGREAAEHFSTAQEIEASDPVKMHRHLEETFYARSEGRRVPIAVWWAVEPKMARAATQRPRPFGG